jgi:PIN domain nuclease of toxin-antitoxin system
MIVGVADTHAALWYLSNDPRLSPSAGSFLDHASSSGYQVGISSISLAELVYLIEKKRLPASVYSDVEAALDDPAHMFTETPCTRSVIRAMRQIPRVDIPDMPDRIIAATALALQVPIISRDGYIRASALQTIW